MAKYVEYDDEREKIRIAIAGVEHVMTVEEAKELENWLKWALVAAAKKQHGMKIGKKFFGSYT